MDTVERKVFTRQMYTADSEVGKMKLQSVKENLYEATTKAVLYSIEMYTKMSLQEWVQTGLIEKLDKANNNLKREREELEQGHIGVFDITNGCSVINDFVRKDALEISRNELQAKIKFQKTKVLELEEKERLLEQRKSEIENGLDDEKTTENGFEEVNEFFDEDEDRTYNISDEAEEDRDFDEDFDDDYIENDEDEESNITPPTEIELFEIRISAIKSLEEIANLLENLKGERTAVEVLIKDLNALTRDGKDILTHQFDNEKESLENLRTLRNTVFAHKNEDQQEISLIGSWEPEAGPLYQWAAEILKYIKIIESRYKAYAWFDDFYASKEGKDKFDGCKVYVQKQIKELYVNKSSISFEFAGDLYTKEGERYNDEDEDIYDFKKLIENMAISWDTGIRYLTVVTNEDLPELNVFFKECLSGTNKYVDYYLLDRNTLRESYRKGDSKTVDYVYFRFLYHLNPTMEKIYWRDRVYTKKEFARQVIYKFIKVKNMFQFNSRLKEYEKYIDGIDIRKWCENHLLSEVFFAGNDDPEGMQLAVEMENTIAEFCKYADCSKRLQGCNMYYRKAIKASVELYFYMGKDYVFSYTRNNGQTLHWRSLEDACKYIEDTREFKSYAELSGFVDEMYKSDYFKVWRSQIKKNAKIQESEV